MLPQWPKLFYDVHPNWYRWHWSHPKFLPASLQILCWKWQVEGMACPGHLDVWIRHISRVLPPYSKRKLFWTGTRSPKFNWLLIFVKIFIAKWYIYIYMKIFFKTNLFILFLYFETQQLKSYSWFIFPTFDLNLVQNDFLFKYGGSICYYALFHEDMVLCKSCHPS